MMILVKWDDHEGVINQEEADQDVADKVSGKVDFGGEVMCSEKPLVIFTEVSELEWRQMSIKHYVEFGGRSGRTGEEMKWYREV